MLKRTTKDEPFATNGGDSTRTLETTRSSQTSLKGLSYNEQLQHLRPASMPGYEEQMGAYRPTAQPPAVQMQEGLCGWVPRQPRITPADTVPSPAVVLSATTINVRDVTRYLGQVDTLLTNTESSVGQPYLAGVRWARIARQMSVAGHVLARVASEIEQTLAVIMRITSPLNETTDVSGNREQPRQPELPSMEQLAALRQAILPLKERVLRYGSTDSSPGATVLGNGLDSMLDSALALSQAQGVVSARADWVAAYRQPVLDAGQAENAGDASNRMRTSPGGQDGLNAVFAESGFNRYGIQAERRDGRWEPMDWCGMFVGAHLFRSAGLDAELRGGLFETRNVHDFFNYTQVANAGRVPLSVWVDGQDEWQSVPGYHQERGSSRHWTPRAEVNAALAEGGIPFQSGDVVLINHSGGAVAEHIVMVDHYRPDTGELVTLEGNNLGIHSNDDGLVDRNEAGQARQDRGATSVALHVREMAGPTATDAAESQGPDAYQNRSGDTVVGVGRFSAVDFEDHRYATLPIGEFPPDASSMSPADMETARRGSNRHRVGLKAS